MNQPKTLHTLTEINEAIENGESKVITVHSAAELQMTEAVAEELFTKVFENNMQIHFVVEDTRIGDLNAA